MPYKSKDYMKIASIASVGKNSGLHTIGVLPLETTLNKNIQEFRHAKIQFYFEY